MPSCPQGRHRLRPSTSGPKGTACRTVRNERSSSAGWRSSARTGFLLACTAFRRRRPNRPALWGRRRRTRRSCRRRSARPRRRRRMRQIRLGNRTDSIGRRRRLDKPRRTGRSCSGRWSGPHRKRRRARNPRRRRTASCCNSDRNRRRCCMNRSATHGYRDPRIGPRTAFGLPGKYRASSGSLRSRGRRRANCCSSRQQCPAQATEQTPAPWHFFLAEVDAGRACAMR
jgi:hypothetical protein